MIGAVAASLLLQSGGIAGVPQTVFRSGVEVVRVDVSVLDRDRNPVRGLTEADFTVLEDGVPQKIVAFNAVDVPDGGSTSVPASAIADVPPDVTTNAFDDRRLFVLVMDDATMPVDPEMVANAKRIGHSIVERLGPHDLMAVVFSRDNRHAQEFTNDRTRLAAAVETFTGGMVFAGTSLMPPLPGQPVDVRDDSYAFQSSIRTLSQSAEQLAAIPDRRKTLIYVSVGVPVDTSEQSPRLASGTGRGIPSHEIQLGLYDAMQDAFLQAQRGNVNIYGFDPGGLGGFENYVRTRLLARNANISVAMERARAEAGLTSDFLLAAAANTGGRALVNSSDFAGAIDQMFRETGTYYLIGFTPANRKHDGTYRRLTIRVNGQTHVEVLARNSYYAPSPGDIDQAAGGKAAHGDAASGLLPATGIPLRVAVAAFAGPDRRHASLAIALRITQPAPPVRSTQHIELTTRAFTAEGVARGASTQTADITLRPGLDADSIAEYELLSHMSLAPGRYELRLSAHNASSDRDGSVFADVEVPDFAAAPLSLSGVVLHASPGVLAAPKDGLASIVPLTPTTERTFSRSDHVTAFLRLYEGGQTPLAPARLEIGIVDARGTVVHDSTDDVGVGRFNAAGRCVDNTFDLPLAALVSGEYLLSFHATTGKSTGQRDVRFEIK